VFFEFHSSHCVLKSQVNGSILLRGTLSQDGLYVFSNLLHPSVKSIVGGVFAAVHMSSFSILSSNCNNVNTSNRLGHPRSVVVTHVLKSCNISCFNKMTKELCTTYCIGKSHGLPSHPFESFYCVSLELIFCDLRPYTYAFFYGFQLLSVLC